MRVLVTGAGGFIGRHVLDALARRGIDVVAVGRTRPADRPEIGFIAADLLGSPDFAGLVAAARATHLLHLAWYAEHGRFWTSPLNHDWAAATTALVSAFCAAGGRRIVAAGTCAEYDWSDGSCRGGAAPLMPATLYGQAKDAAHRQASAIAAAHGVPFTWGRIFLPYGAGEAATRLIPSLVEVFAGRRAPFGVNADARRDFLHARDVAEAFATLITCEAASALDIASGGAVALRTIVETLAHLTGGDASAVLALSGPRDGEPALLVGDPGRLEALGWRPSVALAEGLARVVAERAG